MRLGMGVLGALCLVFGLAPQLLHGAVVAPAVRSLAFRWDVQMTWFGVLTGTGVAGVTVGGLAVIGAAALGGVAFGVVHASPARAVAVFTGGDPLPLNDAPGAVDFAEIAQTALTPVYSLDPDPVYLRIWGAVRDTAARVGALASDDRRGSSDRDGGRVGRDPLPGGLAHMTQLILSGRAGRGASVSTPGPCRRAAEPGGGWPERARHSPSPRSRSPTRCDRPALLAEPDPPRRRGARRGRPRLVSWDARRPPAPGARYLAAIGPAIACTLIGAGLVERAVPLSAGVEKVALCLLVVGFALKLGLIPVYFWLPEVAAHAPRDDDRAHRLGRRHGHLLGTGRSARGRAAGSSTTTRPCGSSLALLSLLGGACWRSPSASSRACSRSRPSPTSASCCSGVVAGGPTGVAGASIGALNHALSKVILFGAVDIAERRLGRPVTLDTRGLAARLPVAAAAFVIGALGFIGVPPGFGFAGYWRMYVAVAEYGGPALLAAAGAGRGARPLRLRARHPSDLATGRRPTR